LAGALAGAWLAGPTAGAGNAGEKPGPEAFERPAAEHIATVEQALGGFNMIGVKVGTTMALTLLAQVYSQAGKASEGLAVMNVALEFTHQSGEHLFEAEIHRLRGELTLQSKVQGPQSEVEREAEECFLRAVEITRQQQAKSLELRAAMSLARLWQQQDKKIEAHQMLAEIYGWFTEGFDTKDLQEAKALLEELS
jgi:predicted ATPase